VVELKYNRSAKTAIRQIKENKYPEVFEHFSGEIILVGINYSKKTKKHTCKIEKINNNYYFNDRIGRESKDSCDKCTGVFFKSFCDNKNNFTLNRFLTSISLKLQ
jgi:hypothetical protein